MLFLAENCLVKFLAGSLRTFSETNPADNQEDQSEERVEVTEQAAETETEGEAEAGTEAEGEADSETGEDKMATQAKRKARPGDINPQISLVSNTTSSSNSEGKDFAGEQYLCAT